MAQLGPSVKPRNDSSRTLARGRVVLEVEVLEVGALGEAAGERLNTLHADTVLGHTDFTERPVRSERFSPL